MAAAVYAGVGGESRMMRDWLPSVVYVTTVGIVLLRVVRLPEDRGPWIVIATGLALYAAGNLLWSLWLQNLPAPPIPSLSDGLWLSLYPASYAGLVWLARRRGPGGSAGVWLDGIVAGLGVAALGAALVVGPVLDAATGTAAAVATNLAYPIGDILLGSLVVGILVFHGGRLNLGWALLGGGFLLLCAGDIIYLLHVAGGSTDSSIVANVFYLGGVSALALAAWQPRRELPAVGMQRWSMLLIPVFFGLSAVGVLIFDHFARLNTAAILLATASLLVVLVRTALTFRDVRALSDSRLQASTDDLTGLANRRLFMQRVDDEIARARGDNTSLALLIIDLDRFKELNDALGHHAGDGLLREIGPRIQPVLRSTDTLARLGGDEFGLLLTAPCDEAMALSIADRVREAMRARFEIAGLKLHVAASVGVALFPNHADDAERLLQCADVAMYQSKSTHTGRELYAADLQRYSRDSLALVNDLPRAIRRGELEVHFQPKADAHSRRVVGAEALVRWRHPERGLLMPGAFLALAEESGVARELTRFVTNRALECCRQWRVAGHNLRVSINLGVPDLLDVELPLEIAAALEACDMPPSALVVEVTESSLMTDPVRVGEILARLRESGIEVSLDDFGTGYSSLVHLRSLPVSEVKIDRSFVSGMAYGGADLAIVRSTIQLAHDLGLRVVGEGVEDDSTWRLLDDLGCEIIQGYLFSRPLPAADFEAFLSLAAPTTVAA